MQFDTYYLTGDCSFLRESLATPESIRYRRARHVPNYR
jgi:hypothetical protein